ncbi:MAG: DUF4386 domain-containing protein [Gemmatimonadales bacterium]
MNATATTRQRRPSPKSLARWVGLLFLATMVGGGIAQGGIAGSIIVSGDAAATAANIAAHQALYRLGLAAYLVEMACQVAMTVLLYELLKPVSRTASAVSAAFGLVGCTIKTVARLFYLAPLLMLDGAPSLAAFDTAQLQAASAFSLRINYSAETIAMVFFGLDTVFKGYLILRSTFLPRALGFLSVAGGLGWLLYLYEPVARPLAGWIVGTGVLGALVEVTWLLVKGVDEQRWREQAGLAA